MSIVDQIKRILTGLVIPQEYCCLELEQLSDLFKVILTTKDNSVVKDVTSSHIFLGYMPLVIGFSHSDREEKFLDSQEEICLSYVHGEFKPDALWNGFPTARAAVATLMLKRVKEQRLDGHTVYLYEGYRGKHRFIAPVHQIINNFREKFRIRSNNNVKLPGNLFDQVRIAYSVPRKICIMTVSDGTLVNMFPTDLHGPVGKDFYAGSLRIGGNANAQVETLKRVVIADVNASAYLQTYNMGKNHMIDLQNERRFMLHDRRSRIYNFPLPEWALRYRELIHSGTIDRGIHRIHFYKVVHSEELENAGPTLAHIQQYFAQWRMDQGLKTTLYFRKV